MLFYIKMSYGLVRQIGPWSETKQDTRFQSYDAHRNYRVDPMLQGAPAPPVKPSKYSERSIIDKRPFMPFRRVNNFRVAVNPYGTKPSLGDSYAAEVGVGGRTLGAAPSKNLPGDRLNPINHPQIKYEGDLSHEHDGLPGTEPLTIPRLTNYAYDRINTAVANALNNIGTMAFSAGTSAAVAVWIQNAMRQNNRGASDVFSNGIGGLASGNLAPTIDAAFQFLGDRVNLESLAHLTLPRPVAEGISSLVPYNDVIKDYIRSVDRQITRSVQNQVNRNFAAAGDVMMQAVLGGVASTTGTAMTATNEMLQDVLNAIADRGGMLTASAIGFLTTVFTIVQLASLNSNQRRIGQGRVREAVRQIEQRPQMRQIADVAANTGRGMIEGAVRSYRNA